MIDTSTSISASVGDLLRHAGASAAADKGQVHVINVAAIRETVGERWKRHEPLVEDFVLRSFRRSARDDDFIVRVNEADFILIQPSREPMAALSRASQLMRETLNFFLGTVKSEHINISIVDSLRGGNVSATQVTESDLQQASAGRNPGLANSEDGSAPWEQFGVARPARRVVTMRRPDGTDLQAVFYLDPVWNVEKEAVVSFVARTVAVQKGPDGDLESMDMSLLTPSAHAALAGKRVQFLHEVITGALESERSSIAVHLPLSLNSVSHSAPRSALLAVLKRVSIEGWRTRAFAELTDVPPSMPHVRLTELVTQLKPFVRGVFVRVPPGYADVSNWARCGAVGLIATVQEVMPERVQMLRIEEFARQCDHIRMVPVLYGVKSRSLAISARASGVRLMSGDLLGGMFGDEIIARTFPHASLYLKRISGP